VLVGKCRCRVSCEVFAADGTFFHFLVRRSQHFACLPRDQTRAGLALGPQRLRDLREERRAGRQTAGALRRECGDRLRQLVVDLMTLKRSE
jgi:hypothetical protein